jgi:outer membrane immunogenic protein
MTTRFAVPLFLIAPVAALGADLGPKVLRQPIPDAFKPTAATEWSGFYVGVNAGAGFGAASASSAILRTNLNVAMPDPNIKRTGPLGGFQAGYALQSGSLVYGLEGDINYGALRGSQNASGTLTTPAAPPAAPGAPPLVIPITGQYESRVSALGTLRARIGYSIDTFLIYGTGGLAVVRHEEKTTASNVSFGKITGWTPGWALGAGLQYAFSRNISAKLEYVYAHANDKVLGQKLSHTLNLVRTGVNYRF